MRPWAHSLECLHPCDIPRPSVSLIVSAHVRIGTTGWSIPRSFGAAFAPDGDPASHLEKYARRFSVVEINSSFYRHHRRATYARWAATVPARFRFAVKLPRTITHDQSLVAFHAPLEVFMEEVSGLGHNLGPLLAQLPPSLTFHEEIADEFFAGLRAVYGGDVVCEPRHPTWFVEEAGALLSQYRVARVAADPACVPLAARPGGSPDLVYLRLHGSPVMYRSAYSRAFLESVAAMLVDASVQAWCIFDNTTFGAATGNALDLQELLA